MTVDVRWASTGDDVTIRMCVLLWAHEGRDEDLQRYENTVLALIPQHGGRVNSRDRVLRPSDGDPVEVQIIEFPDQQGMDDYMGDPRRIALHHDRDAAIARTQIMTLS